MSFIYRMATPDDRNAYIDFINYVFSQAHQPHDFKALLPKVYADGRMSRVEHFLATDENGNIRGCVALLTYEISIMGKLLKVGFIGSVSVHPYARGENHMKHLMAMVEQWMIDNKYDIGLLGGNRQRYQYFGYSKGGVRLSFTYTATNVRHALRDVDCSGIAIREITDNADALLDEVLALHETRPVHVLRERERLLDISHSWKCKLYAALRENRFAGYFVANDDGTIAEWQMKDPADNPKVLKQWFAHSGARRIRISAQPVEAEWIDFLDSTCEDMAISEDENQRIFNWHNVLEALLLLKRSVNGISDGECRLCVDGQPLCIRITGGNISISDEACADAQSITALELQNVLLRPIAYLRPVTVGGAPADWFPLPVCYSSVDGF